VELQLDTRITEQRKTYPKSILITPRAVYKILYSKPVTNVRGFHNNFVQLHGSRLCGGAVD
jgi:hypothetical protein